MIGPLAYIGGKRRIAKKLIALLPEHVTYVEPFAGGAQVLFAKAPSKVEVINDLNGDVVNFFRVCQHHPDELLRCLKFAVVSRTLYGLLQQQDQTLLTDVQRAARFLYLQKNAFGGAVNNQHYHYCVSKPPNYNLESLPTLIDVASKRLARVQIESWPYEKILERFDRDSTLFYLDPPYVGAKLYKFNFTDADFTLLGERLAKIQGKFLLSINDHSVAREAFARFHMREIAISYTAARSVPRVNELVFTNYPLPEIPQEAPEGSGDVV
jgi:DNA adenine methylase